MKFRRLIAALSMVLVAFSSSPGRLSLAPPPAFAASKVTCASVNGRFALCNLDRSDNARVVEQLSSAPCVKGRSWGVTSAGIWVDKGCAATFSSSSGSGNAAAIAGAVIIGGILGAALSHDDRRAPRHYSRTTVNNYYSRDRYIDRDYPRYSRNDGNRYRDAPDDGDDGGGGGRRDEADDGDTGGGGGGYYDGDRDEGGDSDD